jgi:hypothetical protein
MSGCGRFEKFIEQYLAGDISPADLESLNEHSRSCPRCRETMDLGSELSQIAGAIPQPSDGDLREMRASALQRIRRYRHKERERPLWRRWVPVTAAKPVYAGALAIVLVGVGFFLGRLDAGRPLFGHDRLTEEIVRQASQERGLAGYWDSPFVYSNVNLRPHGNGIVTLDFDATRHVSVTTTLAAPLTREILVYAMIDPTTMGTRLEAMDVAAESMDEKLRETLVFILLNDPSLPVRLRSLEILSEHASDPGVQDALLASLAQDPSVQIRMLALDSLAGQHMDPAVIRRAIGETLDDNDRAVLNRVAQLMGSS